MVSDEIIIKKKKFLNFFQKINPYRELQVDGDFNIVEKKPFIYYAQFMQWLVDLHLNGILFTVVFHFWLGIPISYRWVLGNGLTVFLVLEVVTKVWDNYIEGKLKLVRAAR